MIKILDVCSGIGGFSLGLEATGGFDTVAFCEYDEFCRKVLNKHWPEVPIYKDLKEIGNEPTRLIQEFDLICGGIPCQPFSLAGKQKGKEDDRHLWPYMYEIIKHKKPTWVIVENVGGFVNVALDDVCLNLETEGYATQSFIIPACGVSAPHRRERIWIIGRRFVADTKSNIEDGLSRESESEHDQGDTRLESERSDNGRIERGSTQDVADSNSGHDNGEKEEVRTRGQASDDGSTGERDVSNTESIRSSSNNNDGSSIESSGEDRVQSESGRERSSEGTGEDVPNSGSERGRSWQSDRQDAEDVGELTGSQEHREGNAESRLGGMVDGLSSRLDGHYGFEVEPNIPRVAEKIPDRVNRLKALGNAIVTQNAMLIGLAIKKEIENE